MAYVAPTPAEFKIRYPEFTAVDDARVQYWLTDALRYVTDGWIEADRAVAEMAYAAFELCRGGAGTSGGAVAGLAGMGVTDFRSASFSVSFDSAVIAGSAGGGWSSNKYGRDFAVYLRRNTGGPFLAGVPALPGCC